jgi:hypothetical protein
MKKIFVALAISMALVLTAAFASAQTGQPSAGPPLSQSLVREGDFAMTLADSLGLGAAANETEAESALSTAGIAPRNGWIADYPITPDIIGELQAAVTEAADSGRLAMGKDEALAAFQDVVNQYNLNVMTDTSGREVGNTSGMEYPDSQALNSYYSDEGPPVVTYYAPPPDYAYLYTWVPYPFWWWNAWFPGFFVLVDFDVSVRYHGHDHGREYGHISNHFRYQRTGRMYRIDPTNRFRGGTFPATGASRRSSPSAQSGARAIVSTPRAPSGQMPARTAGEEYRGYGGSRSSVGTRSSVFDRSVNRQIERSSDRRGFQSRSNAGQIRRGPVSGRDVRSGGTGGSRGGGSSGGRRR